MGCVMSGWKWPRRTSVDHIAPESTLSTLDLSLQQRHLLLESWRLIQQDIAKVGVILFIRLFETHPECKDVFFLFRDVDDLHDLTNSKDLRAHGLRTNDPCLPTFEKSFQGDCESNIYECISHWTCTATSEKRAIKWISKYKRASKQVLSFVEKTVARIDNSARLEEIALELGRSHYRYNAAPKYYQYVGTEFISAVRPILKDKWTPELENGWKSLFAYICAVMERGYKEEETRRTGGKTSTPKLPHQKQAMAV